MKHYTGTLLLFLFISFSYSQPTVAVQMGSDIDGEAGCYGMYDSCDNSGHSVSLSSDGTIVAIGAN